MVSREGIPTTLDGMTFRSRCEARFAVFLTSLGVRWRYEPGVLKVGSYPDGSAMWYCPDFVLPDFGTHIELKPEFSSDFIGELVKPFHMSLWPLPTLIWSFSEASGIYLDVAKNHMGMANFFRCAECNGVGLVSIPLGVPGELLGMQGEQVLGSPEIVGDSCFRLPQGAGADFAPINRAMAIARGWPFGVERDRW